MTNIISVLPKIAQHKSILNRQEEADSGSPTYFPMPGTESTPSSGGSSSGSSGSTTPSVASYMGRSSSPGRGSARPSAGGGGRGHRGRVEINDEYRALLNETAQELGMDPIDLATIISYETGGTFNPTQTGPRTKWGTHRGLIQFGEPQARQHGVNWDDPLRSQLGRDGAVVRYFRGSGWQPGMGLLQAYSIVNAGGPNRFNRSDTAAGGAPGTVRDKVQNQMGGHRANAVQLFSQPPSPPTPPRPSATPARPTNPLSRLGVARGRTSEPSRSEGERNPLRRLLRMEKGGLLPDPPTDDRWNRYIRDNPHYSHLMREANPESQTAMRQMIERRGYPSVQPAQRGIIHSPVGRRVTGTTNPNRASYNPLANRIYANDTNSLFAEFAHADQVEDGFFARNVPGPIGRRLSAFGMVARAGADAARHTPAGAYRASGTLENEAHGERAHGRAGSYQSAAIDEFRERRTSVRQRNQRLATPEVPNSRSFRPISARRDATRRGSPRRMSTGGQLGSLAGAVAGQSLIPIPGVGSAVGQAVGSFVGDGMQKGLRSNNKLLRAGLGMALGGPAGATLALALGGNDDPTKLVTNTMASQGSSYRKGGRLPDPPVRMTGEEVARRVRASVEADERANPNATYTRRRRNAESIRFADSRRHMVAPAPRPMPDASVLGAYRSLGELRTYKEGGKLSPIGQDAVKVKGPKHAQGGVKMPAHNAEVEGGETIDGAMGGDYVFSASVKVPGSNKTFAQVHEELVQKGASQEQIEGLAQLQEKVTGRAGDPQQTLRGGGLMPDPVPAMAPLPSMDPRHTMGPLSLPEYATPGITPIGEPSKFGKFAGQVSDLMGKKGTQRDAPHLFNIARGIMSKDKTPPAAQVDTSYINNLRVPSAREALSSIDAGARGIMMNASASSADKAIAAVEANRAKQGIAQQQVAAQTDLDGRIASLRSGAASQNATLKEAHRQDTMGAAAARDAMIGAGVQGLRDERLMEERNRQMSQMNDTALMAHMANMDAEATDRMVRYFEGANPELAARMKRMIASAALPAATPAAE